MPLPAPRTWTAGETVTAAMLNVDIRDAINWLLNPPYLHVYQTAAQSLATGTAAALTFGGELHDTISGHSTSVNTSRYTPNIAGKYLCLGSLATDPIAAGQRTAQFRKNGAAVTGNGYTGFDSFGAGFSHNSAVAFATISVNGTSDYIELWAGQDSGGSLATDATHPSFMICRWMGL